MTLTSTVTLSSEQDEIVKFNEGEGALLVVATAGSGKTRILTERVRYLFNTKKGNFSVLCLTFTNKAAEEMQERLKEVKGIRDRAFIGTIHGFGLEILKARRHELGYSEMPQIIEREADRKKVVEHVFLENEILHNFYKQQPDKEKGQLMDKYINLINETKRLLKDTPPQYSDGLEYRKLVFEDYNRILFEQNLIDFDDIIRLAWQVLNDNPTAANLYRKMYRYILVDEAQDLNFAQYNLIKTICGDVHRNVLMVGDPNQSIHGYTGADKKYMKEDFVRDFKAKEKEIYKNYRSSQSIIDFAHRLFPNSANGQQAYYKGLVEVNCFEDEHEEAKFVVDKIKELIHKRVDKEIEGEINLNKIAILARNRFVLLPIQNILNNDPFFQNKFFFKKGSEALEMESNLMKLFDLGTRILANPANQVHFRQIENLLNIENFEDNETKKGFEKLNALKSSCPNCCDLDIALRAWSYLEQNEMSKALYSIEEYCKESDIAEDDKELIMRDLDDYQDTWRRFRQNATSDTLPSFRQFAAMGFNNQKRQKGLTLATVHTVKGLEYDIVFVVGMTQGTFPDYRAKTEKAIEEEKNNANVAFTRARRWLFVSYPKRKTTYWGNIKTLEKSQFI